MLFLNFNPNAMTDQELLDKTTEIHKRLAYSERFSMDGNLVAQLRAMADACAFEARERSNQRMFDMLNKNKPDEKDLTPSPKDKTSAKTNSTKSGISVKREGGLRAQRSSTPVKD